MKTPLRLLFLPFLFLSIFTAACGGSDESSETKWAHTAAASSMSIINSRLNFISLGFKRDYEKLSVCVQDATYFKGNELLFETKLAYAAWLEASGLGSASQWDHIEFDLQSHCDMKDNAYSSVVVIGEEIRITSDQEIEKTFKKNVVSCKKVGPSASCSTGNMILGLGGPGGMSYRYFKPEIWDSVSNRSPATIILSPFVKWTSMAKDLSKTALSASYLKLAARAETVTYAELIAFNKQLTVNALKLKNDGRLDTIVQDFLNSPAKSLTQNYLPQQAAYHVLLHEVGHQFGMDHADNPSRDSETGTAGSATLDSASGKWETAVSTMAYAEEYLYLTADDVAGIRDLARKNLAFVKSHRGL